MSPPANGRRAFTYMCTTCLSDAIIIYLNYSFSLTQQLPICEPPSHSSTVHIYKKRTEDPAPAWLKQTTAAQLYCAGDRMFA